jgi:hypothetical protein
VAEADGEASWVVAGGSLEAPEGVAEEEAGPSFVSSCCIFD